MRRMLRVELVHSDCFVIILAGRRHYVFNLSVHTFVCYQTCEDSILKTNEQILMQIGTNGPRGNGIN